MNVLITLDYELFFGDSGSLSNCIIKPTNEILKVVDKYGIKLNFFVDSGYLLALEKYKEKFPKLKIDYDLIINQLKQLSQNGHSIELHIHPHWEDSIFDGNKWKFDLTRYKLSNFEESEIAKIVSNHVDVLKRVVGKQPIAYRAGGWSAQPFEPIQKALIKNNIYIDSSVFAKGYHRSKNQLYDFSNVPRFATKYKFDKDLTIEDKNGLFIEIPISSLKVNPTFFWHFALIKMLKRPCHKAFGDGFAIRMPQKEIIRLLFKSSYTVVSIDGFKSSLIRSAFKLYKRHTSENDNFVLIGHPKAFTPYSMNKLEDFIKINYKKHKFITYASLKR